MEFNNFEYSDTWSLIRTLHSQVHNLTVRVKGKVLLENTMVSITAGRRYGLAGPNGMGKSTLLRLIARRQVIPKSLGSRKQEKCIRLGTLEW